MNTDSPQRLDETKSKTNDAKSEAERTPLEIPEEVLEILRPHLKEGISPEQAADVVQIIASKQVFRGPMPPPEYFQHYEEVLPGSAERILSMTERSLNHQHEAAERAQKADISYKNRGQLFGFLALVIALLCALVSALNGATVIAGVFLTVTVAGVISKLIDGPSFGRSRKAGPNEETD